MASAILLAGSMAFLVYALVQIFRPLLLLYGHVQRARAIGLPFKVIPFPQGLFSFFTFQILRRLRLMRPGTKLYRVLNMGRPDGYELHKEMGDVFVTVSPMGLGLVVADPQVVNHVTSKRVEFPKPPNTGAIINIYGRNVINADGDVWRFHRRVTGPVFSERIHRAVWQEGMKQAQLMMKYWCSSAQPDAKSVKIHAVGDDFLRLGLNVITGAAYGCPLEWNESPPCALPTNTRLSYRASVEQLTAHLMPLFLTPRWLLRLAPRDTTWGRAWESYEAFGGYMRGMLDRERQHVDAGEDKAVNLLTVLIAAENGDERPMSDAEVMGNAFIFLFAGHETTANTLHYALLLLAQHPDVQQILLDEVDAVYEQAAKEGRNELEYEFDFNRVKWAFAIMYETLRVYTPTGITNKWTSSDQPILFEGRTYVIPQNTRIAVNGTGIHSNPKVWGYDADDFKPSRWIVDDSGLESPRQTPPLTPTFGTFENVTRGDEKSLSSTPIYSPFSPSRLPYSLSSPTIPQAPFASQKKSASSQGVLKPPKGAYLPFSEGSRACSGKKFATVEFVAVMFTLLRSHRVALNKDWSAERVKKVLAGRKAGALTLQPPEAIPLTYLKR